MRLVSGRPLDKVIAEKKTIAERLALLPNVIAVAEALAYAHGERVIHRDLKPANVLVGSFGETVVIDWGLAKDLGAAESADETLPATAPSAPRAEPRQEATQTAVGTVMGTPAYMPPEQARGATVDERADVYAIGAMLYHLLAGAPPYVGDSADRILGQVIAKPPEPLARRQSGVPTDLAAIVDKAMAREPGDRYPTARELAADLERFQAGQLVGAHDYSLGQLFGRWLRRNKVVAGLIAVLIVGGATLGTVALRDLVRAKQAAEAEALAQAQLNAESHSQMTLLLSAAALSDAHSQAELCLVPTGERTPVTIRGSLTVNPDGSSGGLTIDQDVGGTPELDRCVVDAYSSFRIPLPSGEKSIQQSPGQLPVTIDLGEEPNDGH
jgi:hypothetical protein